MKQLFHEIVNWFRLVKVEVTTFIKKKIDKLRQQHKVDELKSINVSLYQDLEDKRGQIKGLNVVIEDLEKAVSTYANTCDSLQGEWDDLKKENLELTKKHKELWATISQKVNLIEKLNFTISTKDSEIFKLKHEVKEVSYQLSQQSLELEEARQTINVQRATNEQHIIEKTKLENQLELTQQEVNEGLNIITKLRQDLVENEEKKRDNEGFLNDISEQIKEIARTL